MKFLIKLVLGVIIFMCGIVGYSVYIEPNLLIKKEFDINIDMREEYDSIKIVQFTDTQLGEFYSLGDLKKVVKKINNQKPDIVVFTGDLMDNAANYDEISQISDVLSEIEAPYGKYAVFGNRDYGGGAVRYYEEIMNHSGFKVLINEKESISINGMNVNIFGADDALMGYYSAEETMINVDEDEINILLLHEPDLADDFSNYPIDLILSGHSHGGQVKIPIIGALKTTYLGEKYIKGFYDVNGDANTRLYVSSGLGNTRLPFRLLNIPEIVIFNIK